MPMPIPPTGGRPAPAATGAALPVPTAWATLARGKYSWIWIVSACPYCGQLHHHYGGPLDQAPRRTGGVVAAHCDAHVRRQQAADPTTSLRYVLSGV